MELTSIIKNQEQMYELLVDDKDDLFLEVVCGGVGMYLVRIRLTGSERELYRQRGAAYVDELARDIVRNEVRYRERMLPI